jgi:hypothetical protein
VYVVKNLVMVGVLVGVVYVVIVVVYLLPPRVLLVLDEPVVDHLALILSDHLVPDLEGRPHISEVGECQQDAIVVDYYGEVQEVG